MSSSGLKGWLYNQLDVAAPPHPPPPATGVLRSFYPAAYSSQVSQVLAAQSSILEWVAVSFSSAGKWKVKVKSLSHVRLFATPWTVAHQASLSTGFFQARILQWVAIPFSRGSSRPRDWTQVSSIAGRLPSEPPGNKRTLWVLFSVKIILPGFIPTTSHVELTAKKDIHVLIVKPPCHNINFFNN